MTAVPLDPTIIARLAEYALDTLWMQSEDEDGCCPTCCAPCSALKDLLDAGRLEETLADRATTSEYWDPVTGRVDLDWLDRAWRLTSCHE